MMDHIQNILIEERAHSKKLLAKYEAALKGLPNGSLSKKKINGKAYYYLVYRLNGKLIFQYLGKLSEAEIKLFEQKQVKKQQYRKNIRDLKEQIKYLNKILK